MLNTFLALLLLTGLLLLEWLGHVHAGQCRDQTRRVRAWWQAHALFSLLLIWLDGLAVLERLWLQTLWPEAAIGAGVLTSVLLLHLLLTGTWFHLQGLRANFRHVPLLALLGAGGMVLSYLPETPQPEWLFSAAMLLGVICGWPHAGAMTLRAGLALLAAGLLQWLWLWPRAAMVIANTLPGHYNSLVLAGVLFPWLLLPLWLLPAWLTGARPAGFCNTPSFCYRKAMQRKSPHA